MIKIRKINVGSSQDRMEKDLIVYTKEIRKNNQRVTILIIYKKVFELSPSFKVGKDVPNFMEMTKNWLYYGLKPRYCVSFKYPGAPQKVPAGWEEKAQDNITRVGR